MNKGLIDELHAHVAALSPFVSQLKQMGQLGGDTANAQVHLKWQPSNPYFLSALISNTPDMQQHQREVLMHNLNGAPKEVT